MEHGLDIDSGEKQHKIAVLAKSFQADGARLRTQLEDLQPLARRRYDESRNPFLQCWVDTIRRVESRSSTSMMHPTDAIRQIVYRYAVFKPCTSRLEQDFSVLKEAFGERRLNALDHTEDDCAKVILDYSEVRAEHDAIVEGARAVWAEHYGQCRKSDSAHDKLDKGRAKITDGGRMTKDEFTKRRRREGAELVSRCRWRLLKPIQSRVTPPMQNLQKQYSCALKVYFKKLCYPVRVAPRTMLCLSDLCT